MRVRVAVLVLASLMFIRHVPYWYGITLFGVAVQNGVILVAGLNELRRAGVPLRTVRYYVAEKLIEQLELHQPVIELEPGSVTSTPLFRGAEFD